MGCDGCHPKVPADLNERDKRRSGGILGEGGTVWEIAARRLHNDVLLDSEERHERAARRACAHDDSVGGQPCERQRVRNGSTNFELSGMPRMGAIEEPNALCW